jgi:hypothetical protein
MIVDRICVGLGCALSVGLAGCSSSSSSPPAEAYVTASVSGGSGVSGCDIDLSQFAIGSQSNLAVNGQGANVSCSVKANGGGFDVSLSAHQGIWGFSVTPQGHVAADVDGGPAPGTLPADINDDDPAVPVTLYDNTSCVLSYESPGHGSVGPGKIWGTLTCTDLVSSQSVQVAGGGTQPMVCSGIINFEFENCAQ